MDKNMIKIDDLVRQRLTGGEERERPGAWLNMREMLDQEMPAGALRTGTSWRRMFSYASALLLLTATCIGSYKMKFADATASPGKNITTKTVTYAASPYKTHIITGKPTPAAGNLKPLLAASKVVYTKNTGTDVHTIISKTATSLQKKSDYMSASGNQAHNKYFKNKTNGNVDQVAAFASGINTTAGITKNSDINNKIVAPLAHNKAAFKPESRLATSLHNKQKHTYNHGYAGNNQLKNYSSNILAGTIANNNKTFITIKDSVQEYHIVNHYQKSSGIGKGYYHPDTVLINKREVTRITVMPVTFMPAGKQVFLSAVKPEKINFSAISDEEILLAASQDDKSAKRKIGFLSMARIEEMLDEVKENLGQVRFHPGLLAGVNSTFGPNTSTGFQLGASGEFTVSQHLSLMLELKYIHHFNNGTVFNDNYTTYTSPMPNTWEKDSLLRSFSFSTLHTVELPLSIRYAIGDFTAFAGANLVYNFAINHSENDGSVKGALNTGSEPVNMVSGQPKLTNNDFASQFATGYVVGLGYRVTPAVQFDLRLTQTFWDNAKTNGSNLIANDFYRSPSIQLSVGYKFGASKKFGAH